LHRAAAEAEGMPVDLRRGDLSALELADGSVDVLFCHQTFHHLTRQRQALAEFYRVLKPGGLLLFAESTRAYICSWIIRLLFRHPMEAQHTANEYIAMIRAQGFEVAPERCSFPYLWWSRSDLGLLERIGVPPPPPGAREETLINLVAGKPA
jgi:ubiquinone/menaquinone biosynthesis C-methylase UbiE